MEGIRKYKMPIKIALLMIFLSYFASITFFTHTHVINGVTIVHSHPFAEDNEGKPLHEHTGAEIQLINTISTFFSTSIVVLAVLLLLPVAKVRIIYARQKWFATYNYTQGVVSLRAPPFFTV